ncbi:hypothetical protein GBAR_LOCUS30087 [Geodia barretti]|uniref:Transmembrane protein n=1 Tax=Geodia barretti TaxID=519541 RepID=A0AA35TWT0_GEOBA|nr:hypothetical protein GBAR_LOCUS30087 [Geodia barretti]
MEGSGQEVSWDKPPPYHYQRLPQNDHPMSTYTPVPATPAPAQPAAPQHTSFSNNTSSNNVVVVSQPSAAQPSTVIVERVRPSDNLIWVLCLMVVCFCTGNLVAFVCLIPALIFSLSSGCASNSGDYETAATYGKASCCCSLFSVTIYMIAVLVAIIFVILIFTTGLAFLGIAKEELA